MPFDSTTNTIKIEQDSDLLADSGSFFLKVLKDLATEPGAAEGLAADWAVVARWLGCTKRELTETDYQKFGLVFRSYLARGVAPSVALEEPFKKFSLWAKSEAWPIVPVPQELVPVFRRMLASDDEIQEKRANDTLLVPIAGESLNATAIRIRATRRSGQAKKPDSAPPNARLNWIPLITSIAMLLMASAEKWWPDGFYQLLRIVVTSTAGYIVVQTVNRCQFWPWIMAGIAILFNPLFPIDFTQQEWQPIDFGAAVILLIALIQTLRRRL